MQFLVHGRPTISNAGRQQETPGGDTPGPPSGTEQFTVSVDSGDEVAHDTRAIFLRLFSHLLEQLGALDTVRIAGMIVRAGDHRCAALAGIDEEDVEVEAGEIDGRGQARRPAADDQAIEWFVVGHSRSNGLRGPQFPISARQ